MSERFEVDCQGARHTLSLADGVLTMLDHDVEAEDVLGAMGGSTPLCMRAVDAWSHYEVPPDDPRQLIAIADLDLLSDQGRERIARAIAFTEGRMDRVAGKARAGRGEQWARYRARHLIAERFSAMVGLPQPLRSRWLARYLMDAERAWTPTADGGDPPAIEVLLLLACEQALAGLGDRTGKKLWWKGLAPGAQPAVMGEAAWAPGVTLVGVSVTWLREMWLPGRATEHGRLALAPGVALDFDDVGAPVLDDES